MKKQVPDPVKKQFPARLLKWDREKNRRQMPWKGEKDPYKIWLSEIILQQTRVEQGLPYYQNFLENFPGIHQLAAAPEQKVFKLWEGLGYYTRCRNLLATAKLISHELDGKFPDSYETIKSLKGIGPYTAAAISSFAYDLPHAVVDGNVFRVLARVFGITQAIDSNEGKKNFTALAGELLDKKQPGKYNQAIMDFGAMICKPAAPLCTGCPFQKTCYAFTHGQITNLPVKEKKTRTRKRWFYYLVPDHKGMTSIRQRTSKDIWQGLYEFELIESTTAISEKDLEKAIKKDKRFSGTGCSGIIISPEFKQQLSHQLITGRFIELKFNKKPALEKDRQWVKRKALDNYPFPRFINQYLQRR